MAKTTDTKHELEKVNKEHELVKEDVYDIQNNKIFGQDISFLIGNRIMQRTDPIYYCENTLRCHLPEKKRHLHENQVELIKAVCNPHYRKVAGLMARQAGKCFEADTLIMMADGTSKKVQDIKVGDYVMSPQSTPSEVIALGSGYEEMYEICTAEKHYKNFTVNGSHILAVKDKKNKIKTITVNDYLKLTKYRQSQLFGYRTSVDFEEKPVTIDPYYLGLWLGDGRSNYSEISNIDEEIINYVQEYAERLNMKFAVYEGVGGRINSYAITNGNNGTKSNTNYIIDELRRMNLYNNKHIPDEYLYNSMEIRKKLLAGLIDTDGYKEKNCTLTISFANKNLADDTLKLLQMCGYRASMKEKIVKMNGKSFLEYVIYAYGDFTDVPIRLKRKQYTMKPQYDHLKFGFTIKSKGVGKYYGFVIKSDDHLFLLDDCTVVHNTESIASFTGYLLDNYPQMRIGIFTPRIQQAEVGKILPLYS